VIDVAVGLVKIAITVIVITIPDVEFTQVFLEIGLGPTLKYLARIPVVHRIVNKPPNRGIKPAVDGGPVWHLGPVSYIAIHCIAVRRLFDVEITHGDYALAFGKQCFHVVVAVEIGNPQGRIVQCPVRLGYLVVLRAGLATCQGRRPTFLITEIGSNRPDQILANALKLYILAFGYFTNSA